MSTAALDTIAEASTAITSYMNKQHESDVLNYVKHFGKKTDAVSATLMSLNSTGLTLTYKTRDGSEHEILIKYTKPITKHEEVKSMLFGMAKEAKEALSTSSSPSEAIQKAIKTDKEQEVTTVNADVFYPADRFWQIVITIWMGALTVFGNGSDECLGQFFPSFVLTIRGFITQRVIYAIYRFGLVVHSVEGIIGLGISLHHGWYSATNTIKWTISSLCFGMASISKLLAHGRRVRSAAKKTE